jgi:hypothetical protein
VRIVVLGYLVRGPLGGLVWHHLQYAVGLARLGHDVTFVEDSDDHPWSCYDPERHVTDTDPTYGLRFAAPLFERVGLGDGWAYHDAHRSNWLGPAAVGAVEPCERAELVLNLGGVNPVRPWLAGAPARVLVDTDPVFTQIRHLTDGAARARAEQHTAFLSFGENVENLPDDGLPWRPTRQPVVLDLWDVTPGPPAGSFTTVMQWESYPPVEHEGRPYGMKSESFAPYVDLPRRTGSRLELALGTPDAPRALLAERGWSLANPLEVARDAWDYQSYIRRSKGEFAVAKHGYVAARCGWFSERSACYLATGRPVVAQDTGFSDRLATGSGLFAFSTPEEAAAALAEVVGDYQVHCRAARSLAEQEFDSATVLAALIEEVLAPV